MKKLILLLLFTAFYASGQTTIANKLKVLNSVENNSAERVIVQDPVTKEYGWILKSSLVSAPQDLQSVTDVGSQTTNIVYFPNNSANTRTEIGTSQVIHYQNGGDTNKIDVDGFTSDGPSGNKARLNSGIVYINDTTGKQTELHPDGITASGLYSNFSLADIYTDVKGLVFSAAGNEVDVTDSKIEIIANPEDGISLRSQNNDENVYSRLRLEKDQAYLMKLDSFTGVQTKTSLEGNNVESSSNNLVSGATSEMTVAPSFLQYKLFDTSNLGIYKFNLHGLDIENDDATSYGLRGLYDYTANISDLDYPQETYVIPRSGTKVGKPVTGDIEFDASERKITHAESGVQYSVSPYYGGGGEFTIGANLSSISATKILSISVNDLNNSIRYGDVSSGYYSELTQTDDSGIRINSTNPAAKGITGIVDFTPNITNLDYVQKIYADSVVSNNVATNATTVVLSAATLSSTYPSATKGFKVHALSIIVGGMIYEKTATGWCQYAATVTP